MKILWACFLSVCFLSACAQQTDDPVMFLPKVRSPEGADLEALRAKYCQGIALDDQFLTPENFRAVFNCANYDSSLNELKNLFTNSQFPDFLKNVNAILSSDSASDLKDTLKDWLEEGADGESRLDRLLPAVADIIKNQSFQDALPVISNILNAGSQVWRDLLPGLADVVYSPRFEDNFEDILTLFSTLGEQNRAENPKKRDYSDSLKDLAKFIKMDIEGETVAMRALELADQAKLLEIPGTTIPEYLDQMNVKGVIISLYQETGALRGEIINPKLNADPDDDELRDGLTYTPAERQYRAYKKLFARGENGETAPIVQLSSLVHEFHQPHDDFLPALSRWFSSNGPKISRGIFEYVAEAQVRTGLVQLNLEAYLIEYSHKYNNIDPSEKISAQDFVIFLATALQSSDFSHWMAEITHQVNEEQFGPKNAQLLSQSLLNDQMIKLYRSAPVIQFGYTLFPNGKKLPLSSVIKRFSNLHRGDKLQFEYLGKKQNIEKHLVDIWTSSAKDSLGESVVLDFALKLVQSLFTEFASDFGNKHISISQWYYNATYGGPDTTEALAGYAFKELNLLSVVEKNRDYLKNEFANEVFPNEEDRRAFRLLVDQVPNIWLYIKSGFARSGNDLSRALSEKDQGYLIQNYVKLIADAYQKGLIAKGARLIEEYQKQFPYEAKDPLPVEDILSERRKISMGADALKRVLNSIFEPEVEGDYDSSTLRRLLVPLSAIVDEPRRASTEKFMLTAADEIIKVPDEKIDNFFRDLEKERSKNDQDAVDRRATMKSLSELLKNEKLPLIAQQLSNFFQEDAVKPALDFFAKKVDDGTLPDLLKFIRRVLGFKR